MSSISGACPSPTMATRSSLDSLPPTSEPWPGRAGAQRCGKRTVWYCFAASRPGKSLLDRFDGLRLVWRHLPVPELHPRADLAAELCELAGLHGKFWDAHSLLLTPRGRFSRDDLLSAAGRLELDPAETHAALGELRFRERVLADNEGGRRAGVNATPTFFLDGERLDRPWRELPQIVRASLASA
jgi:protein-disulfide isomerase